MSRYDSSRKWDLQFCLIDWLSLHLIPHLIRDPYILNVPGNLFQSITRLKCWAFLWDIDNWLRQYQSCMGQGFKVTLENLSL